VVDPNPSVTNTVALVFPTLLSDGLILSLLGAVKVTNDGPPEVKPIVQGLPSKS
jgi:hypothetical protein